MNVEWTVEKFCNFFLASQVALVRTDCATAVEIFQVGVTASQDGKV